LNLQKNDFPENLLVDIQQLIIKTRESVAVTVNTALTMLYWKIGKRIREEILEEKRAEYGKQIVSTLSRELKAKFGSGFSEKNLRHMMKFSDVFLDRQIVSTLSRQLSWSHFKEIIYQDDELKRKFYAEMCRIEGWSVRVLREKIDSMFFERTALSRKPEKLVKEELDQLRKKDKVTKNLVLKDPYVLDFLELNDRYLEKNLEDAILRELENFLLEFGIGFSFIARQKRIQIDNDDFYIDLLFYNRKLRRLIAVDLKLGNFKAAYKGQMELYLRWLDQNESEEDDNYPLGIILCTGKKKEQIELLELDQSGIHVAEYLTELPEKQVLRKRLERAVETAQKQFDSGPPKKSS
jgi:predicted nuclease of restriction endonuclease-like (RecB) superfamily